VSKVGDILGIRSGAHELWSGFLKGLGSGIAGIAVKPIVGGLDLASKTTKGKHQCTAEYLLRSPLRCRIPFQAPLSLQGAHSSTSRI